MRVAGIFTLAALAGTALASPTARSGHVVHERRHAAPAGWKAVAGLKDEAVLPMSIALKQQNLDNMYESLMEVSHPASPNYGKHWTVKEVKEHFAPSEETVSSVQAWLLDCGIATERVTLSEGGNWLRFNASVGEAETLLKTKYHVYQHESSGTRHVASKEYSIPKHLVDHIDFVTPSVHFDTKVPPADDGLLRKRQSDRGQSIGVPTSPAGSGSLPKPGQKLDSSELLSELAQCDEEIVPDCLRVLYQFEANTAANLSAKNSFGIVEYTPQAYLPSDLDLFFADFAPQLVGKRPTFDSIDGGILQTEVESFDYNGESDLDLEYAMSLVYPQKVTLYQVGDLIGNESFNNFLDAIDGSYCTYDGGDDPTYDGVYPDPAPDGYKGPENCGGFAATKTISTSYAYNEADLTPFYEERQCNEYAKLGLLGVSFFYSSGDYGVAGNGGQCIDANGTYNDGSSGRFNPSFPGTCPYITSVGATQVKNNTDIVKAIATGTQPEIACETVIYSGGGFSNVFPIPDYQAEAVATWFEEHPPPYGADRFNNSQKTRGFPDISANGANFVVAVDGGFELVYGTSASSPTTASIFTLINQARLDAGKSSVGFINPTLYSNPAALNDIVEGGNQGCGTPGFEATTGWDPVTGLGTPNYPELLKVFLALP